MVETLKKLTDKHEIHESFYLIYINIYHTQIINAWNDTHITKNLTQIGKCPARKQITSTDLETHGGLSFVAPH